MGAAPQLLREWDWLQEQVIPSLVNRAAEHPKVWSIGSAADAVAVTVAFAHAAPTEAPGMRAFVSGLGSRDPMVSFGRGEVSSIPDADRSRWFREEDRRWVPDRPIAEQVMIGEPSSVVDLVTIRSPDESVGGLAPSVLAQHVRPGGQVLFLEPPEVPPPDLKLVGGEGRLYRTRGRPPAGARVNVAAGPEEGRLESLAQCQLQQELVTQHVRLARALARRFLHRGEPADELEQVALVALVKASRRFDPNRANTFATYASVSILGELKRHFRDKTWMLRVPRSTQELYLAIKDAREELGHEMGRAPTPGQIGDRLGVGEEAVLEAMEAGGSYWTTSLDLRGADGERGVDIPVADTSLDRALDRERLRGVLPRLDHREQLVLRRLFFDGYTQQRVADELGASQMQVSRLLARTIAKLRRWCSDDDKEPLDDRVARTA
jgi:RNA polymerase sigma-B factor